MKKTNVIFFLIFFVLILSGCQRASLPEETLPETETAEIVETEHRTITELHVVTSFAGDDTNAENYRSLVDAWERDTGNVVIDDSSRMNGEFIARVKDDFARGEEPDVLFFMTGAEADELIEADKVVPLAEIRARYPQYGSNMDEAKLPLAMNGEKYVLPVNGVWVGLYVNQAVLAEAGVAIPGENDTWEQFLQDCEAIKNAGKLPVAFSADTPHYWLAYLIENYSGHDRHLDLPLSIDDAAAQSWISALSDIKTLCELGYFPEGSAAGETEMFAQFVNGDAAFLLDGSWRMADIVRACCADPEDLSTLSEERLENFTVTYVPAGRMRRATDLVGGCTMGYYITRKAWADEAKREAAVSFVEAMTTDDTVFRFAGIGAQALKNPPSVDVTQFNSLQLAGYDLVRGATSWTASVIDNIPDACGEALISDISGMARGWPTPETVVQNCIAVLETLNAEAEEETETSSAQLPYQR